VPGPDGSPASLSDLAAAANVSTTTLKHYFGDRDGVIAAVLSTARDDAAAYLSAGATAGARGPERSLPDLLLGTVVAWQEHGLDRLFTGALSLGLGSSVRGPAFLQHLLEPFLQATEALLAEHEHRGQLPPSTAAGRRSAALALLAPVVLALLHQDALGGTEVRPLDVRELARAHAALVLHGLLAPTRLEGHPAPGTTRR
jgi:AcrR family transcriptional regulator